jgi:hypothetical protein
MTPSRTARDPALAGRLWAASVEAVGVGYEELCNAPKKNGDEQQGTDNGRL